MPVTLKPVKEEHIGSVKDIHRYYVENTLTTFRLVPKTIDEASEEFKAIQALGLPYIVALDDSETVVGYSYASPFRGSKGGYHHTAELSLFLDYRHQGKGIGTMMLKRLLEILKDPHMFLDYFATTPRKIRALIACMSVDTSGKEGGMALRDFYLRFGFRETGRLEKVGFKFGKW
jgi:L-amino acid N-acyltransferase YncA